MKKVETLLRQLHEIEKGLADYMPWYIEKCYYEKFPEKVDLAKIRQIALWSFYKSHAIVNNEKGEQDDEKEI